MRRLTALLVLTALGACGSEPETSRRGAPDPAPAPPEVDFDRVDAVRVGMSVPELEAALGDSVTLARWNPPFCDYAYAESRPALAFMIWGDSVVRIDVDSAGVLTHDSVGVGTPEARVLEVFPDARVGPHPYSGPVWHYLTVDDPASAAHGMIFETDGETVRSYRVGFREAVMLIEGCS